MDTQLYSIRGGGQVVVSSLVEWLTKEYKVVYVGDNEFKKYTLKEIKPFSNVIYKLGINRRHLIAKGFEKLFMKFPELSHFSIRKADIEAKVAISNSPIDYLFIKNNPNFDYKSIIIIKHNPYYIFSEKYPDSIIRDKDYLILVENETERKELARKYRDKVKVWYPPVKIKEKIDMKNVSDRIIELVKDKKVVISIGRLDEKQKRFSLGIRSMKKLIELEKNLIYLIVGEGPDEKIYKKQINSLKLENKVVLTGFLNEDEKAFLLKSAKVLLSVSDRETFGLVMAEGLGHGLPVISTKTYGALDFIKDGENGFLVDANEAEIAKKIKHILDLDENEYKRMSYAAKKSYLQFKPEYAMRNFINIIKRFSIRY